jgi:hypothetical protein
LVGWNDLKKYRCFASLMLFVGKLKKQKETIYLIGPTSRPAFVFVCVYRYKLAEKERKKETRLTCPSS